MMAVRGGSMKALLQSGDVRPQNSRANSRF
jgi:hypothetical protein